MENINEKAQSVEDLIRQMTVNDSNLAYIAKTGRINGSLFLSIKDALVKYSKQQNAHLEQELAKSQEKCKVYEGALEEILGIASEKKIWLDEIGRRMAIEAEQALKPKEGSSLATPSPDND